ncbi:uncharacterized protein DS421_16g538360 [Arachis hypogaea]|nr:uncharacterized protein DS421_16g538360 [Arachis hypogaea]
MGINNRSPDTTFMALYIGIKPSIFCASICSTTSATKRKKSGRTKAVEQTWREHSLRHSFQLL